LGRLAATQQETGQPKKKAEIDRVKSANEMRTDAKLTDVKLLFGVFELGRGETTSGVAKVFRLDNPNKINDN
jgi:hypothetical protein